MTQIRRTHVGLDSRMIIKIEYEGHNSSYSPHSILTTRNGYQWSGVSLASIDQVVALRDALTDYINERTQ